MFGDLALSSAAPTHPTAHGDRRSGRLRRGTQLGRSWNLVGNRPASSSAVRIEVL